MRVKNRRKYIRLEAYHLGRLRLVEQPEKDPETTASARISNISAGGCCVRTDKFLPVGCTIELQIIFPRLDHPISVLAKVMWAKQIAKTDRYKFGVQFLNLEDKLRKQIDEQIKNVFSIVGEGFIDAFFGKGGAKQMKGLAKLFMLAALICIILAIVIKVTTLGTVLPGAMPVNWIKLADTALLFTIALALLGK